MPVAVPIRLVLFTLLSAHPLAAACLVIPHQQARAQPVPANSLAEDPLDDLLTPGVGQRDIEPLAKLLAFTKDQRSASVILLNSFLAEHTKRLEPIRAAEKTARATYAEDRDPAVFAELDTKKQAFAHVTAIKRNELIDSIKSLLTQEQVSKWPMWERAQRRAVSIERGTLIAENVDLIELTDRLGFTPQTAAALAPELDVYSIELDAALIARDRASEDALGAGGELRKARSGGGTTDGVALARKKADEAIRNARQRSLTVRDINRAHAGKIESIIAGISADDAKRFASEFRRICYPSVYEQRPADRVLSAATMINDLSDSQRATISSIKDQYARDRVQIEQAACKVIDDADAAFLRGGLVILTEGAKPKLNNEDSQQSERSVRQMWRDLDDSVIEKVKASLTPNQVRTLP